VAFLIDTSVAIALERGAGGLQSVLEGAGDDAPAIAAITASEMFHGVYRADTGLGRERRLHHVEPILSAGSVVPYLPERSRLTG